MSKEVRGASSAGKTALFTCAISDRPVKGGMHGVGVASSMGKEMI